MTTRPSTPAAEVFLDVGEVAKRYGGNLSVRTLNRWRQEGRGPAFMKAGRRVLYRLADVVKWEKERTARITSIRR